MTDKKNTFDNRSAKTAKPRKPGEEHQASVDEFEREGMGVAPKE